jgi:hypothetical protein
VTSLIIDLPASYRVDPIAHYAAGRNRLAAATAGCTIELKRQLVQKLENDHREALERESDRAARAAYLIPLPSSNVITLPPWPFINRDGPYHRCPTIKEIQYFVGRRFDVLVSEMKSARRTASVVRPRQIAMYLSKILTPRSLPEIGRHFGGRDHTTVLHAVRKIGAARLHNAQLDAELRQLESALRGESVPKFAPGRAAG